MAVYAKGRKSLAISDRSGFRVPYQNLRTEWNGLRVSPDDYDPKHPQLTPAKNITDPTALYDPRPDNDPENVTFYVNYNWFGFTNAPLSADGFSQPSMNSLDYEKPNLPAGRGAIGKHFITTPIELFPTGVSATGSVGTETLQSSIDEAGVAGTGAVGTETLEASITEVGVAGTGAVGVFGETDGPNLTLSITESGVAGTGAVGSESVEVDNPTWGTGTWGTGKWGQ